MCDWDFAVKVGCVFVVGSLQAQGELMIHGAVTLKHYVVDFTILPHTLLQFHPAQLHMRATHQKLLMPHQVTMIGTFYLWIFCHLNLSCKMMLNVSEVSEYQILKGVVHSAIHILFL